MPSSFLSWSCYSSSVSTFSRQNKTVNYFIKISVNRELLCKNHLNDLESFNKNVGNSCVYNDDKYTVQSVNLLSSESLSCE